MITKLQIAQIENWFLFQVTGIIGNLNKHIYHFGPEYKVAISHIKAALFHLTQAKDAIKQIQLERKKKKE